MPRRRLPGPALPPLLAALGVALLALAGTGAEATPSPTEAGEGSGTRTLEGGIAPATNGIVHGAARQTAPDTGDDPRALARIGEWIEAAGGMERYRQIRTGRFVITTEIWDTASGRLKRTRPRYVEIARTEAGEISRVERWEGDDFIRHGWDGERAWAIMNDSVLGPGDKDWDEAAYVASDVQYWISLPYKLMDPGVHLRWDGTDAEGREVVRVTFGDGVGDHQDTWHYRFREGRSWPVQVEYVEEGKEDVNRLRFEDVREVDGYVFVGRRVHFNERGQVTKVLHTHDVEINPELDLARFSGPPALRAAEGADPEEAVSPGG